MGAMPNARRMLLDPRLDPVLLLEVVDQGVRDDEDGVHGRGRGGPNLHHRVPMVRMVVGRCL